MSFIKKIFAKKSGEKPKKKIPLKKIYNWLDVVLLIIGMVFISIGIFIISLAAGLITIGICLIALAFFVAIKQAKGG